ncbi:carbonate dehydratase [Microbulbifer hydrolyticus]|uniref:Carbonic anhydrase n=1 Tax=Microbulbifer hydrolyticus TaxID=48074 RepID=A0A6P1TDQ7_9GAMM|nr:carbonate dehydratase [Microbulbifer hydrolyticus]MBB5212103.1 carbonic anhydrase [Microbulbifer hydrolyticus]QHQ39776.1 carbonate dehydratase [Microbulbifer hydrolyticus]
MSKLNDLIEKNRAWSESTRREKPDFFLKLSEQQSPEYLWIGCADSRVPANQIVDLLPGELFVHRNVANVVVPSDLNCLSVVQFAVEALKVKHIMVVGHYGCGGVQAALEDQRLGLIESWLRHIKDVRDKHHTLIELFPEEERVDLLCELNVLEQVIHVCQTTPVRDAWENGQELSVHGWVYGLSNGLVNDLQITVDDTSQINETYHRALTAIAQRTKG